MARCTFCGKHGHLMSQGWHHARYIREQMDRHSELDEGSEIGSEMDQIGGDSEHKEDETEDEEKDVSWGEIRTRRELEAIRDLMQELEIRGNINPMAVWHLRGIMRIMGLDCYCASHVQFWEKVDTAVQSACTQTTPPSLTSSGSQIPPPPTPPPAPPTTSSATQTPPPMPPQVP